MNNWNNNDFVIILSRLLLLVSCLFFGCMVAERQGRGKCPSSHPHGPLTWREQVTTVRVDRSWVRRFFRMVLILVFARMHTCICWWLVSCFHCTCWNIPGVCLTLIYCRRHACYSTGWQCRSISYAVYSLVYRSCTVVIKIGSISVLVRQINSPVCQLYSARAIYYSRTEVC